MARPLSLDREAMNLIVGILERGLSKKDAYEAAGVPERTFNRWQSAGKAAERKAAKGQALDENERALLQFWQAVKRGAAKGKALLVGIIMDAAQRKDVPRSWIAAAWLLERQHPQEFGRKYIKLEVDTAAGDGLPGDAGAVNMTITIEGTGEAPATPAPPEPPAAGPGPIR